MNNATGRGWAFPPRLNDHDRMSMVQDDSDIRQSIYIVINTAPGERVMHPDFGCRIHELIFAPANNQTAAVAERFVREAIERWEPRIDLTKVKITMGGAKRGEMIIEVEYRLKDQPNVRNLIYPFYLLPLE